MPLEHQVGATGTVHVVEAGSGQAFVKYARNSETILIDDNAVDGSISSAGFDNVPLVQQIPQHGGMNNMCNMMPQQYPQMGQHMAQQGVFQVVPIGPPRSFQMGQQGGPFVLCQAGYGPMVNSGPMRAGPMGSEFPIHYNANHAQMNRGMPTLPFMLQGMQC